MFVAEVVVNRNGTIVDQGLFNRFRDDLLPAKDFDDLLARYSGLMSTLDSLGITKSASMKVDRLVDGMQVVIDLVPAYRIKSNAGTHFSSTGPEITFRGQLNNMHGHGQKLNAQMSYKLDPQLSHDNHADLGYIVPVSATSRFGFRARMDNKTLGPARAVHESLHGLSAWAECWHRNIAHTMEANWNWRENTESASARKTYNKLSDRMVIEQRGHSLKTSLVHQAAYDRMSSELPQFDPDHVFGFKLTSRTELAGALGSVMFGKWEGVSSMVASIGSGVTLATSLRGGLVFPKTRFINDRFFLGGPQSVRGFPHQNLGPRLAYAGESTAVGGDLYYAAGASLFAPLPTLAEAPIRLHAFCNLGKLLDSVPTAEKLLAQVSRPSVSVGSGVCVNFGQFRVEVNYTLPLVSEDPDASPGLSFGVGVEFL